MINQVAAQTIVTSAAKAYDNAKKTGTLNASVIALYNLIAYYAEFTKNKPEYNQEYAFLVDKLNSLKYDYPTILCNYKGIAPTSFVIDTPVVNTAPTVDANTIDVTSVDFYNFTVADFVLNFADAESHKWKYLMIIPNAVTLDEGQLEYPAESGNVITEPVIINIEGLIGTDPVSLTYKKLVPGLALTDLFTFRVSDDPADFLYSIVTNMNITADASSGEENLPATIGDNTIYTINRAVTILTLDMFTSQLAPPYSDPEADLIDAIRIDEISTANIGTFYVNAVAAQEGDIITREDLIANLFTHEGPDQDTISSDVINFSARDEGSQIWVQ